MSITIYGDSKHQTEEIMQASEHVLSKIRSVIDSGYRPIMVSRTPGLIRKGYGLNEEGQVEYGEMFKDQKWEIELVSYLPPTPEPPTPARRLKVYIKIDEFID